MSLRAKSALVVGVGGLGSPAAVRLAAAGLGRITLLDDDRVDASNLGRQMLFGDADVGALKAEVAAAGIRARFPEAPVESIIARLSADEAGLRLVATHDVVLDGSDNFPTRFAANDLCVAAGVPLVHGASVRWQGQVLTILPGDSACLRCVFEGEPPPDCDGLSCAESGIVAPLVGLIGAWMAEAAVAVLSGLRPRTADALRLYDGWAGRERVARLGRDPDCSVCGRRVSRGDRPDLLQPVSRM
jgi:adenylyltransferase/sulfurtransferase